MEILLLMWERGAGFPGVVLKIYVPGIRLALVEASKKKAEFSKIYRSSIAVASSRMRYHTCGACRSLCPTVCTHWAV